MIYSTISALFCHLMLLLGHQQVLLLVNLFCSGSPRRSLLFTGARSTIRIHNSDDDVCRCHVFARWFVFAHVFFWRFLFRSMPRKAFGFSVSIVYDCFCALMIAVAAPRIALFQRWPASISFSGQPLRCGFSGRPLRCLFSGRPLGFCVLAVARFDFIQRSTASMRIQRSSASMFIQR